MKPDIDTILDDARKFQKERFGKRDAVLKERASERANDTKIDVPKAYDTTAHRHKSEIINDEGRQIGTLVYAMPVPHITPDTPENQPLTTANEQFLIAFHQECEAAFGPVWWQSTLEQIHSNISWDYLGWRRVPYKGGPKPPPDGADMAMMDEYGVKNDRFKKEAGVRAYADYRHVPTSTAYPQGNVYDPDRFYEIKEVAETDLMNAYGVVKNHDGSFSKPRKDVTSTPSGYPEGTGGSETRITVVEYWDREWCVIVAETSQEKLLGFRQVKSAYLLDEWRHGWGRVPYFARPAFVTEQLDEDKKFAGPLDGVYTEMPEHKLLRTMGFSVAYQTAFSPLQIITKEQGDLILDADKKTLTSLKLVPGEAMQLAPGQQITVVPQSPEVANLSQQIAASQQLLERYSLSPITKGIAPGADSSNAGMSNLHRFQLSTLDPMAQQASRQATAMYRFVLERVREMPDRCFVFDKGTDKYLSLSSADVISLNVQAKVTPDQGQFKLLVEKHATELWTMRAISKIDMYEMMGYENPEEKAKAVEIEDYAMSLKPVVLQQVTATLGLLDATNAMIQANAQTGSAANAIPGLMQQAQAMQEGQTGMGQGSPGQPRTPGVRTSPTDVNTQEAQSLGY